MTDSVPLLVVPERKTRVCGSSANFQLNRLLAGSVEATCKSLGLTEVFAGVIIVAIIGNASEFTAVVAAFKNQMDLSLSIAVGSSLQIALFITPVLIFASYLFGLRMTLEFSLPEVASLSLAVGIVVLISGDGECNWFEGAQLLAVYLIIAVLFFFLPARGLVSGLVNAGAR